MIEVYDSLVRLETLDELWRRLEKNPAMRVFQTHAWNRAAAKTCAERGTLNVVRWYSQGTDEQVIFPGWIDGHGNWRFIGDEVGDVGGCVYGTGAANRIQAYREFAEWIGENKAVRRVWLQKLDGDGESLGYFTAVFQGAIVFRDHLRGQLWSEKTDDFIAGQTHLKQRERSRLRAIEHRSENMDFRIVRDGEQALADLESLAGLMVRKGWRKANWIDGRIAELVKTMTTAGLMEAAELVKGDELEAVGLRLVKDGQSDAWLCAYRERDILSSLYVRYMEELARTAAWRFDFGVGAYKYKWQTFRPLPKVSFTFRYSKGTVGKIWDFIRANIRLVRESV